MLLTFKHTRYACYVGYITQGIINNLLPLLFVIFQDNFGLSYGKLGGLILINFVTQLIVDVLSVKFGDRIGYRVLLVAAHICATAGLVMVSLAPIMPLPIYSSLTAAVIIYAVGGGLLEVLVSPVVDSLPAPEEEKGANMSLLHSFYCWGQVAVVAISTITLLVIGTSRWQVLPVAWAIVPLLNTIFLTKVPMTETVQEHERTPLGKLFKNPVFLAAMLMMICSGASELTISQWASMFAEQGLGLSKVWGDLAGPCLFAVMMGIGRTIYGVWGSKIKLGRFMAILAGLCVVCYIVTVFAPHPVISLIACALSGFSVSAMWPGTFTLSSARFPMGGTAMFAILAMSGDIGCASGPWLAGLIAGRAEVSGSVVNSVSTALFSSGSELKMGILVGTIFPVLLLIALPVFSGKRVKTD